VCRHHQNCDPGWKKKGINDLDISEHAFEPANQDEVCFASMVLMVCRMVLVGCLKLEEKRRWMILGCCQSYGKTWGAVLLLTTPPLLYVQSAKPNTDTHVTPPTQ
jgi:hypothetical protein